ncbi:flagellar hook-length control protein FliK [Lachnotalea glycerini]|uniref:Flagellar hook-length control protein-like C-terminal domain-containing protein n=1 Tax=Lachnotalea glycerini TaxID=1763509 RepID=A0A371JIB4_9FIRM|nr:flagellar hook-length control protein FliK [Lachnotalea glycerini]RDY32469.1 hypothetical protein CG710_003300 [Lachnotalea glycerini]
MNTTSVDSTAIVNALSVDKVSRQDDSNQTFENFSNLIDRISTSSQNNISDTSGLKSSQNLVSKNIGSTTVNRKLVNDNSDKLNSSNVNKENNSNIIESNEVVDDNKSVEDVLDDASEKIKNILIENLNISEEDLESVMQMLGLNYLDCLDKNNLAQVLTQISGNSDISALITDESLYQQFNDSLEMIAGVTQDILSELGITEDNLMAVIEQQNTINENAELTTITENTNQTQQIAVDEDPKLIQTDYVKDSSTISDVKLNEDKKLNDNSVSDGEKVIPDEPESETVAANTQDSDEQQMDEKEGDTAKEINLFKNDDKTSNKYQDYTQVQGNRDNVLNNLEQTATINETSVDVESILRQIESQVKVSSTLDTSKMEFQLNPEHLGKLTIQVASKEGIITAQITAQNLAIKEVLESQIVQLKENMNNQGLKVDAVEVTVESHEFERNLEEGNSSMNQEQFEQQKKNTRRQFNYNDFDTLEDLSDEEALIAEMMIGNGNSVNYTA